MEDVCAVYHRESETIDHTSTRSIWRNLLGPHEENKLKGANFITWLDTNLEGRIKSAYGDEWNTIFAIAIWWIWRYVGETM